MYKLSIIFLPVVSSLFVGLLVYEKLSGKLKYISDQFRKRKSETNDYDEYFSKIITDQETRAKVEMILMKERTDLFRVVRYLFMGLSLLGVIVFSSILLEPVLEKLPVIFGKIGSGLATIGVMFISLNSWTLQTYGGTTKAERLKDTILFTLWTVGIALVFFSK